MKLIMQHLISLRQEKRSQLRVANGILAGVGITCLIITLRSMELGVYVQEQVDKLIFSLCFIAYESFWGVVLREADECAAKMK